MNDPASTSASAGRSGVVDAADIAVVIEARQLRRRFQLVRRVLRGLLIFGFVGGCLAAIAIPSMASFPPCRSHQSEAKGNLKALYVAEESYRGEFDVYQSNTKLIGFEPRGNKIRYRYVVTDVVTDVRTPSFVGWAFSTAPYAQEGDVWRISDKNDLENVVNGCAR